MLLFPCIHASLASLSSSLTAEVGPRLGRQVVGAGHARRHAVARHVLVRVLGARCARAARVPEVPDVAD